MTREQERSEGAGKLAVVSLVERLGLLGKTDLVKLVEADQALTEFFSDQAHHSLGCLSAHMRAGAHHCEFEVQWGKDLGFFYYEGAGVPKPLTLMEVLGLARGDLGVGVNDYLLGLSPRTACLPEVYPGWQDFRRRLGWIISQPASQQQLRELPAKIQANCQLTVERLVDQAHSWAAQGAAHLTPVRTDVYRYLRRAGELADSFGAGLDLEKVTQTERRFWANEKGRLLELAEEFKGSGKWTAARIMNYVAGAVDAARRSGETDVSFAREYARAALPEAAARLSSLTKELGELRLAKGAISKRRLSYLLQVQEIWVSKIEDWIKLV